MELNYANPNIKYERITEERVVITLQHSSGRIMEFTKDPNGNWMSRETIKGYRRIPSWARVGDGNTSLIFVLGVLSQNFQSRSE